MIFTKLDLDLVRNILFLIEDKTSFSKWLNLKDFLQICPDKDKVVEHLYLLEKEGFIEGKPYYTDNECDEFIVTRISMKAHEYLSTIRNETIWNKTKEKLSDIGGSAPLAIIQELAADVTRVVLGI